MKKNSIFGDLEKAVRSAQRSAGQVVGKKMVRARVKALGNVSQRRKKGVRSVVAQSGLLVFLDHAPMAMAHEFGMRIMSKGRDLFIKTYKYRHLKSDGFFTDKKRGLLFHKDEKKRRPAELVGVFRKSVLIKKVSQNKRMMKIAEDHIDEYENEIVKRFKI